MRRTLFACLLLIAVLAPSASAVSDNLGDTVEDCKEDSGSVTDPLSQVTYVGNAVVCIQQGCIEFDEPCTRECNELYQVAKNTGRSVATSVDGFLAENRIGTVWDELPDDLP